MHYTPSDFNVFKVYDEYKYKFPLSSGAEIDLMYKFNKSLSIGTGILYQKLKRSYASNHWTDYAELSIPLKVSLAKNLKNGLNIFFSTGVYFNNLLFSNAYNPHHVNENGETVYDIDSNEYGVFEIISADIFIEAGIEYEILSNISISFSPLFKYRVLEIGFSPAIESFIYGIKFGVTYKI
jgi:hypothetical protein